MNGPISRRRALHLSAASTPLLSGIKVVCHLDSIGVSSECNFGRPKPFAYLFTVLDVHLL
ncbi:hypothetical protein Gohar_023816, partial [Gossypium harknessii]|nr:hypothetical protein [Gossypium harknessii]